MFDVLYDSSYCFALVSPPHTTRTMGPLVVQFDKLDGVWLCVEENQEVEAVAVGR